MGQPPTDGQIDWSSKFLNVPAATLQQTSAPAPADGPSAAAPGGDSNAIPADSAEQTGSADESKMTPIWLRVPMDRLTRLDTEIGTSVLAQMNKAIGAEDDIPGIAALAGAPDLDKPADALAPLKKMSKVSRDDRNVLKNALGVLNNSKTGLTNALNQVKTQSAAVHRAAEALRRLPVQNDACTKAYEAARTLYENLQDAVIQTTKFALEIAENPASAILELLGTDFLKGAVMGGNGEELLARIGTAIDSLRQSVNDIISALVDDATQQLRDSIKLIGDDLLPAVDAALVNYKQAFADFNQMFKAIKAKAGPAGKGSSDAKTKALLQLYNAIIDTQNVCVEARAALDSARELSDLAFWADALVPLGSPVREDTRGGGQQTSVLYSKGGKIVCFFLPVASLKHSFEDMSAAVDCAQKFHKMDHRHIEARSRAWMAAMVDSI